MTPNSEWSVFVLGLWRCVKIAVRRFQDRTIKHPRLPATGLRERTLWVAVIVVAAADLVTTMVGLERGGFNELNPITVAVYDATGLAGLPVIDSGYVVSIYAITARFPPEIRRRLLLGYLAVGVGFVVNNLRLLGAL